MKNISLETKKLALLFIICLLFSMVFSLIISRQPNVLIRSDHFSLWYSVNKLVTEQRSIYDPQNGTEVVALNSIPVDPIEGGFYYPAHLIIFFLPIARLPYPIAHFLWIIAVQLFLIIGLFLIYKEINWPHSVNQFTVLLILSILFIPNLQNTIWGQYNSIGVLFLALVYITLRRKEYFLSGVLTIGLTFKPQNYLLPLLFLLFWALSQRKRWNYIIGFLISCFGFWLFAEFFEPNWVVSFFHRLIIYNGFHQSLGVLDYHRLPFLFIIVLLIVGYGWLFIRNYKSDPNTNQFIGCLVLSLGIWWIIVPVVGMMHLVALPVAVILLFSFLENKNKKLSIVGFVGLLSLYGLGLIGFLYGLTNPGLYGVHIQLAELAYKVLTPLLIIALAIPLCISKTSQVNQDSRNPTLLNT